MAPASFQDVLDALEVPEEKVALITGNASTAAKEVTLKYLQVFTGDGNGFCSDLSERVKVAEVSILVNPEESSKREARVVCELMVEEEMLNQAGNLHGGCSVFLVDQCSTLPIAALMVETGAPTNDSGVSQSINTVFHAPAPLGTNLRIVTTSVITDSAMLCSRAQIWDADRHKLLVSGVHMKMIASAPRAKL
ncbi:hypothetical protein HGRIS_010304 [Hohenbuehelia grisea]|uniref:Thioesterase domain-containing protein n=1 Tax=Hohenbuehelia grisea TaxID=104357 RepID=A0ABR3J4B6_9AGAR